MLYPAPATAVEAGLFSQGAAAISSARNMTAVSVKVDTSGALRLLARSRAALDAATIQALNWTAFDAAPEVQTLMSRTFDRPTPYTLKSVSIDKARPGQAFARLWFKPFGGKGNAPSSFLAPQVLGGPRSTKRFERALLQAGVMPAGTQAVPGKGARLDAYGNMSAGQIVQIISYFKAFPETGYRANITDAKRERIKRGTKNKYGREYFISWGRKMRFGRQSHLAAGVWERVNTPFGSAISPILMFVRPATYQRRLPLRETVERFVRREFPKKFERAKRQALAGVR